MGKAKTSRKGKKAWRRNIPTNDLEELVERSGREERSGGALLGSVSNDSLFFVDKSGDESVRRKIDRHRGKVLHCDSVLQRSSLVPALPASNKRKLKDRDLAKRPQKRNKVPRSEAGKDAAKQNGPFDLWEEDEAIKSKWAKHLARFGNTALPNTPAVEIDAPGCSFNPTYEDHQEALGAAVAQEMQQVYKKELEPEPIPLQVPGSVIDEEDMYFIEADQDDNDGDTIQEDEDAVSRAIKVKKLTRTDLNKKARKKEMLKQEAMRKEQAKLMEEINRLPEIKEAIQVEDEEKKKIWTRRMVSKKERQANCPPRLGKHKFKPDSVKVLLSEEVTGSLRKLKGCYSLLRERYKSLQRRGLVEPRVPVKKKVAKMWVNYESGTKGAKERETHASMVAEREARKHALAVLPVK
ncbi:ribosome biogenesis protein NOP53-like [Selaginella moellendorffii]|uniref:ribosome biogenesis protein NOP53-like n=1 Tax=Selaginella moellendorffii TaxID=88036 RepID=UPI000D1CE7BC|nr:ribosome biogenesis protein NOP53-like [Selaginella moellendorffii]|eukprot:XP_024526883.1 ribosome biogenesis protein NOP53-like [Selaginella moellendorffii]